MSESWYEQGYTGIAREEERIASMSGPFRLWIPPGKSNEIVFVDDVPTCIYEHNWKMNGNWRNWYTCLKGTGTDDIVCCQEGGERSRAYVGYFTIVQCTETTDKKGNKYQYELQLLGAKLKTLKKFRRKKDERGALALNRFRATREDDKSPSVGDEFEHLSEVKDPDKLFEVANYRGKKLVELWDKAEANAESMARLKKVFKLEVGGDGKLVRRVVPFNYAEVLAPREAKELRDLFKSTKIEDSSGDDGGSGSSQSGKADENVPF